MVKKLTMDDVTEKIWRAIYEKNSIQIPFFNYGWHKIWFDTLGKNFEPLILLVNDTVIAPFAKKQNQIVFSGGEEVADYLDIIGLDEHKTNAWIEIIDYFKKNGVAKIQLKNISQSSPTISFFENQGTVTKTDTTPIIKLPGSLDEHLSLLSRKHRHELRRKLRKFEREHPFPEIVTCSKPPVECNEFFRLMRLNPRKNEFLTPEMQGFFQKIIEVFEKDIRLLHLKVNGKTVSSLLSFMTPTREFVYNSGFDEQGYSGAGFYLKAKDVQAAIENGLEEYNFLQGSERYKYELGAKDFFVYSVSMDLS